ncbi:MAG TPA: TIGR03560 family F420-dependent LLM class oxidoreductase [Actinomycetota bacterium]|nr:TIGR03560 family F420-dependent LLM class oxidoreductase [Actinomycetota bacterium]
MRFCLMIEGQEGVTWERWLELAAACERLGFDGLFRSDHYFSAQGAGGRGATDAWTLLAGLAARTERLRLGTLVSPVTFREPALLAKAATTVDEISGGRVEIGMGAGWWTEEHTQHGFRFPPTAERFERLEEQLAIVDGLLTKERVSFQGKHYRLADCEFLPKPVQKPRPPIIVGGKKVGPWMQRLIGSYAEEFNTVGGTPDVVRERFARAREGVKAAGRASDSLTTSFMTWVFVGATQDEYLARVERARSLDPTAGAFDLYLADIEKDCIVGTPERAAARLRDYEDAGVQRIFLNHELYDDDEMLDLLAKDVLPRVAG